MSNDHFKQIAQGYDQNELRVATVTRIAGAMQQAVELNSAMHLLDLGAGTGLLLERIAPLVGKITALDPSSAMNRQLEAKRELIGCELAIIEADLSQTDIEGAFDGIISSMTLHHIEAIGALLLKLRAMLNRGGFIALADLDREDGRFHSVDTGVFHHGFDREQMKHLAIEAGFGNVAVTTACTIAKPQGEYPVFLLTATAD